MVNGFMAIWMIKLTIPIEVAIHSSEPSKTTNTTKVDIQSFHPESILKGHLRMVSPKKVIGMIEMERSYETFA